ncbi:Protein of unknown function DUF1754 eukaryotic [Penicillium mononematosum]|uniref:Protein of unknown function DUF1754 eukaryotic n=1 Tax=Penicillium mononematosum TaxID=268346 RepID=UPI0025472C14|nr:Protein of unknown function DUF1754 eukaryotic [Penicillium mononematosum]KAJ6180960.1 Protein of unknown function DUF1754 eukaryotic [Penicillium mononematosum]
MAGDEYSVGGGKLKLKGSKVSGGRIEKKKKKSTKKKEEGEATQSKSESTPDTERPGSEKDEDVRSGEDRERERDAPGKTEAEKRAEEIRRKRLHERLQREGVKTHKERVEELNKYLSRLSEHHDMPKIGPG